MYAKTVQALGEQAVVKLAEQKRSLLGHLVRSALAGMYVGASIVLIFTIGGLLAEQSPGVVRLVMGVCFGGALTIVVFAGSELFTGSNLVVTLGVLTGKVRWRDLASNWGWTWLGNLAGSVLFAWMVIQAGLMDGDTPAFAPINRFVLKLVETKMNLPPGQLILRAILANWLVCLGVWMAARIENETARILMIWWCMFLFITSGYEHSVANMTGLMFGLLLPHEGMNISLGGYAYNLALSTFGNVIGGAVFVAGLYWLGSPRAREQAAAAPAPAAAPGPVEANGAPVLAPAAGAPRG
jgi:nitrite transporter NirC